MTRFLCASAVLFGVFANGPVNADLVVNGSFETGFNPPANPGDYSVLSPGSTDLSGWTVVSNPVVWARGPAIGIIAPDGDYYLDLTADDDAVPHGGISQQINTIIGQSYGLAFSVGTLENPQDPFLLEGPVTVRASAGGVQQDFTTTPDPQIVGNQWQRFILDFTATSTSTVVSIIGQSVPPGGQYIGLDDVSVDGIAATPEPSGLAMLVVGAGMGVIEEAIRKRRNC